MSGVDTFLRDDGCEEEFCFSFDEERTKDVSAKENDERNLEKSSYELIAGDFGRRNRGKQRSSYPSMK
jgi:hypothetical protein